MGKREGKDNRQKDKEDNGRMQSLEQTFVQNAFVAAPQSRRFYE